MNSRKYIGILVIILTFLGIIYQQHNVRPNQEIILEFSDVSVTSIETQSAINLVKTKLYRLGVHNIYVAETDYGPIRITYYSDLEPTEIKRTLSMETHKFVQDDENKQQETSDINSSGNSSIKYDFNVFELQQIHDLNWNSLAFNAIELTPENEQVFSSNIFAGLAMLFEKDKRIHRKVVKISNQFVVLTNNICYKIPQVRAGPMV